MPGVRCVKEKHENRGDCEGDAEQFHKGNGFAKQNKRPEGDKNQVQAIDSRTYPGVIVTHSFNQKNVSHYREYAGNNSPEQCCFPGIETEI
jgi:hypothetical protein